MPRVTWVLLVLGACLACLAGLMALGPAQEASSQPTPPSQPAEPSTQPPASQRVAEAGLVSPCLTIVGEVVRLQAELAWFEGAAVGA